MQLEILRLKERVSIAFELGESHFREFKSCWIGFRENRTLRTCKDVCRDIAKTLVAFANADGGELLIGVEDNGEISGFTYSENEINFILKAPIEYIHKDTPLPPVKSSIIEYDKAKVIYFSVKKGSEFVYLTSDGRCLQRKDLESVPISSEEIKFSRQEKISREYDRQYVDLAEIKDLDIELITHISQQISSSISPEKFLQHLDLADFDGTKLRLRKAALLLFAKKPYKWHPRIQVRIVKVHGTELLSGKDFNVVGDEEVSDNIINLIEASWDLLRPHLTETRFSKDAIFKTQIIYPELACKETLINAIAHRDYSIEGQGIEVYIYSDRLEVLSPGELLSSIKIEDLKAQKGVHQSRNSLIARTLREIGYMRELGEGMRRIYNLMKNNDLLPPELNSGNKTFSVTLFQKHTYSTQEKLWLSNFNHLDLSREQKTVVRLGCDSKLISPNDIWEAVGIVDTDYYRQLLESLRLLGILKKKIDKNKAYLIAKSKKVPKKAIPQFVIVIPNGNKYASKGTELNALDKADYSKIYITNLPFNTNEDEIEKLFSAYGVVTNIQIPKNFETKLAKGFAFVEFENKDDAEKAFCNRKLINLRGRKIFVQRYEVLRKNSKTNYVLGI